MAESGARQIEFDLAQFRAADTAITTPALRDLYQCVTPQYATIWREIGTQLDLPNATLSIIQANNPANVERCCNAMLSRWLEVDTNATWQKLLRAIDTCTGQVHIQEHVVTVSNHLKSRYIRTRFISEGEEWPPDQPKHFTNLSLIHHKGGRTQREAIAIAEATRSGDIDTIMSSTCEQTSSQVFFSQSKTSKDVKEIFAPIKDGQYPCRILIEGAPGIGKTVLSKEISVQWANGQLLKNEILVFLIFLRDPLVQNMMSLKDFVKYYYQFDESSDSIASSCADYLLQSNGDRVTFIFDGYDEYPKNLQQKSFISDILCCRRLSNCGLVLTSRPHASVHHHYDQLFERHVEILGFTKEDRMNYITSSLEEKGAPLIKYLDSHLTISSLCFIPFNMTMLLWLYNQGVVLPNSSTELYNYFICHTICHHIAKVRAVIYGNIINLNDFEQPYKKIIQQLAFLSYKALNKSQLTFTLDEVKAACPQIDEIPGAINCFGLLQVVRYPGIMKMTTTLSFIHFSLQEFLAAYHITCLPYHDELFALKEQFMSDVHANMFSIYVGITKGMRPAFKEYLRCGTSEGLERLVIELPRSEPFGTSELAESGVAISNEFLQDKHMCLRLFKCFHEAGDKSICSRFSRAFCSSNDSIELLLNHGLDIMSPLSPSDVECLVSILASKQEWQNLSLSLSDISIEILHQLLTTSTPTIYRISLYLSSNNTSSSNLIAKIVLMCKTTRLAVIGTFCTATVVNSLKENGFLRILYLYINRTEVLKQSLQGLKYNNILQQLVICGRFSCVEQCQKIGQSIKQLNRNIEVRICQIVIDDLGLFLHTEGNLVYVPDS